VSPEARTGSVTCLQVARPGRRVLAMRGCAGPERVRFRRQAPRAGSQGPRLEESPGRRHLEGAAEGNLRRTGRGSGDQRLCSRAVLVAEVDERRRVHAFGHGSSPHAPTHGRVTSRRGSASRRGAFASRKGVKRRRGLLAASPATVRPRGPWESRRVHAAANLRIRTAAMPPGKVGSPVMRGPGDARETAPVNLGHAEGAVVDGRRPGPVGFAAFDEAAGTAGLPARWRPSPALSHEGAAAVPPGRTRGVRGHVTSSARG
jgi:hypothetical protein